MKNVLITGGSRGIGRACALEFGRAGFRVAVNYLQNQPAAHETRALLREHGCDAEIFGADVSLSSQVSQMFDEIERDFGEIDTLVCNAGISAPALFTDITDESWRSSFATNVDGTFFCCRRALLKMIAQKRGNIIIISSMWGQTGGACEVAYSATKAALIGLARALAKEVGPSGIRVNCIAPGVIATQMNECLSAQDLAALADDTPLCRIGEPHEVASVAVFLASESASFITGQVIAPNGGIVI